MRAMLVSTKAETFTLRRPDGKRVTFECGVAPLAVRLRVVDGSRLRSIGARSSGQHLQVNDEELYKAGKSVLLPGGQILITSTPWAETGSCIRMWRPGRATRTWRMPDARNDKPHHAGDRSHEAEEDRTQRRESSARFMTSGTTVFFESSTLDAILTPEPFALQPGDIVGAGGGDLAQAGLSRC